MVKYGLTMCFVLELRRGLTTALILVMEFTTVTILKMPELTVRALKEQSDFKEALPLVDVWRFGATAPGAQCVMIAGIIQMQGLSAGS